MNFSLTPGKCLFDDADWMIRTLMEQSREHCAVEKQKNAEIEPYAGENQKADAAIELDIARKMVYIN